MYKEHWKNYYFKATPLPNTNTWEVIRKAAGKTHSDKARLKLEWVIFYHTVGKRHMRNTARHFGITRKTLHKWLSRFKKHSVLGLEEQTRTPKKTRTWTVTPVEQTRIVSLRKLHMTWGKEKLKRAYKSLYTEAISTHKIQKVICAYNLYPDTKKQLKRRETVRRRQEKTYITTFEKRKELGFLWHTDAIIIWWYGTRRVIFTALEEQTKIAYARVYTTNSSKHAADFLGRLLYLSRNQVKHIHHDNGSEFYGQFEEACKTLGIPQIFSRVRTPKDNASLERFNRTIQEEWLSLSETGLTDILQANPDLTNWLIEYNDQRPHQSLDYMSPLAYATKTFEVSPMWASSTIY